jgi:hypothetical protein
MYFLTDGEKEFLIDSDRLLNQPYVRGQCFKQGIDFPPVKQPLFEERMINLRDEAVRRPASDAFKGGYEFIGYLKSYFGSHIPSYVRERRDEYMKEKGPVYAIVRIRFSAKRIHFKGDDFKERTIKFQNLHGSRLKEFLLWFEKITTYHNKKDGKGWWRCTCSVPFDLFHEDVVDGWLNPEREEKEEKEIAREAQEEEMRQYREREERARKEGRNTGAAPERDVKEEIDANLCRDENKMDKARKQNEAENARYWSEAARAAGKVAEDIEKGLDGKTETDS